MSLTSHTMSVKCLKWGGGGLIYSASQDRTIKVWRTTDGALCRTLQGHGHWVNVLALNTDYVRAHHMFSRILNFLFVIVFSKKNYIFDNYNSFIDILL
jgi:WD40 repeat protein